MHKVIKETSGGASGAVQGSNALLFPKEQIKTASELPQKKVSTDNNLDNTENTENINEADLEALERKSQENEKKKMGEMISEIVLENIYNNSLYRRYYTKKIAKSLILKEFSGDSFFNSNSSGINLLLKTMKNIQPKIKEFYLILTSNKEQRDVFKSSLISRIKKFLDLLDLDTEKASEFVKSIKSKNKKPDTKKEGMIFSDEEIQSGKRKVENIEKDIEPDEFEGQDLTGYNLAKEAFKYINSTIENDYLLMTNPNDKLAYTQYLIIHLYHHMESWEEDISQA